MDAFKGTVNLKPPILGSSWNLNPSFLICDNTAANRTSKGNHLPSSVTRKTDHNSDFVTTESNSEPLHNLQNHEYKNNKHKLIKHKTHISLG
jgi:hypothetical protein